MYQKTSANGFVKDTSTNFVLNTNQNEYQLFLINKKKAEKENSIQNDIEYLKKELSELKLMFQQCMNGKNNV